MQHATADEPAALPGSPAQPRAKPGSPAQPRASRAAVVANPTKFDDIGAFRESLCAAMGEHGWSDPLWLETTADDPGEGQARAAAQAGVDLIVGTGGDGTITSCAAGVAGTSVPLAIIPAGTGNLLARNLGLPMDPGEALEVALTGSDQQIDVGVANGTPFVAMAGIGLDADMLNSTSEAAKKRFGYAAYGVSVLRHLRDRPIRATLTVDDGPRVRLRTSGIIVGNVGWLQAGLPLLPDAAPDDGVLDVVVLPARGGLSWLAFAVHVLLRHRTEQIFRATFTRLRVDLDREHMWEVDGEVIGRTRRLDITLHAEKLTLRTPVSRAAAEPAEARDTSS